MNKKYYWQKTEKCASCVFNDDPNACHYYGYRFWPELPLVDDCWQWLSPEQWKEICAIKIESDRQDKWQQIRLKNHPDLPQDYQPDYALHYKVPPEQDTPFRREMFFDKRTGQFLFKD